MNYGSVGTTMNHDTTANDELLLDFRLDPALQTATRELSEAQSKLSDLKDENETAKAELVSATATHRQTRRDSHKKVGRASKDDVETARVKEEAAGVNVERTEAEVEETSEDVTRLSRSVDDARRKAIDRAQSNQRKKLLEHTHLIMDGLSKLSTSVAATKAFNSSLAAIPSEGVIAEVRELAYLYTPSYLLDFLADEPIRYIWQNILQVRIRLDKKVS